MNNRSIIKKMLPLTLQLCEMISCCDFTWFTASSSSDSLVKCSCFSFSNLRKSKVQPISFWKTKIMRKLRNYILISIRLNERQKKNVTEVFYCLHHMSTLTVQQQLYLLIITHKGLFQQVEIVKSFMKYKSIKNLLGFEKFSVICE